MTSGREEFALLSVSDKSGLADLGGTLVEQGYKLLSTGGTFKALKEAGLEVTEVAAYTGSPEIMNGRVKTLHPKIHGGILCRRDNSDDLESLKQMEALPISVVVVNLYPFEENSKRNLELSELVEFIDVGGPTMTRAAAKNFHDVFVVTKASQYSELGKVLPLDRKDSESLRFRQKLAATAFEGLSKYDDLIASSLKEESESSCGGMQLVSELRYGENPHQAASFSKGRGMELGWKQLQGKELSYNNILDLDVALDILRTFANDSLASCFLLKHLTPCGAAQGSSSSEALTFARASDPRSHFGGIVVLNRSLDSSTAEQIMEDFVELVVVPELEDGVAALFERKKNVRLIVADAAYKSENELRSAADGFLSQKRDRSIDLPSSLYAESLGSEAVAADFAWRTMRFVKSNAILLCKAAQTIGVGVGETSRIDALENAIRKAKLHGHSLEGSICASDAFFPFVDSVERLAEEGVKTILVPSGAKRDDEVQSKADELGLRLCFMKQRHFRH